MASVRNKGRKKGKAVEKASFGSVLGDDFRPMAKRVKVKRRIDRPSLRRKDLGRDEGRGN